MNPTSIVDPITMLLVFVVVLAMVLMRRHAQNKLQQKDPSIPDAWTVDRLDRLERSLRHDITEANRGSGMSWRIWAMSSGRWRRSKPRW